MEFSMGMSGDYFFVVVVGVILVWVGWSLFV